MNDPIDFNVSSSSSEATSRDVTTVESGFSYNWGTNRASGINQDVQMSGSHSTALESVPEYDKTLDEAVEKAAIPPNAETAFIQANKEVEVVKSDEREAIIDEKELDTDAANTKLFHQLLNEGNFVELAATIRAFPNSKISDIGRIVLEIAKSPFFHAARISLFGSKIESMEQVQNIIMEAKTSILATSGVPSGVTADMIFWDALSFKIPAGALELFIYQHPTYAQKGNTKDLSRLSEIEDQCFDIIKQKCKEYRARTETEQDDYLPDATLFLELQIAGYADEARQDRIAALGQGMLMEYVNRLQAVFVSGNLPGTIQPSKIHSCHDVVTAAELRGSIMKMSTSQLVQEISTIPNINVMNKAYNMGDAGTDIGWTQMQDAAIQLKRRVDGFSKRVYNNFGQNYDKPMANLEHQLAGSANNLRQTIQLGTGDLVVNQNYEQKEISKQQLSVLLSCLRMRANAVQQTDWELVSQSDLDHMEIVRFLCLQAGQTDTVADQMYRVATTLLEAYARGHNVRKFGTKSLPADLHELLHYCVFQKVKQLGSDLEYLQDKNTQANFVQAVLQSLAQRQRIEMDLIGRTARKKAKTSKINIYLD